MKQISKDLLQANSTPLPHHFCFLKLQKLTCENQTLNPKPIYTPLICQHCLQHPTPQKWHCSLFHTLWFLSPCIMRQTLKTNVAIMWLPKSRMIFETLWYSSTFSCPCKLLMWSLKVQNLLYPNLRWNLKKNGNWCILEFLLFLTNLCQVQQLTLHFVQHQVPIY